MKVVYISGRITAPTALRVKRNIMRAERAGMILMRRGYAIHNPHKNTELLGGLFSNDPDVDWEEWITRDLEILSRCDIIYMLRGWKQSRGARAEYAKAKELGLEIQFEPTRSKKDEPKETND